MCMKIVLKVLFTIPAHIDKHSTRLNRAAQLNTILFIFRPYEE